MSDVVAAVCPCVPDDGQWCKMCRAELLCGKEAKDIPDKLVDEVLRKVDVQRAKILQLVPYMHREYIITSDEHQQLTNPQTTDLMRGNLLSRILMGKQIHWLLKFCHCLLQSYESERGLDIHYTLLQQIKGDLHYHLKEDPLQQDQGIYAENVASNVKQVPITHHAKERLIRRLNIESHRHLLDYLNQVTTSDVAKTWLSANVTRDWTVLVEALFTEPGLGCSVSGVLPLSSSNPPAVWNYVRDMGKDWEHLARFLGYSDSLISEIQTKRSWDVKSQIHSFMRVCLIPDCGERRTEEIMEKIDIFLGHPSQSDHKSVQPPEAKGAAKFRHAVFDNSASPYKKDYQPVYHTDSKGHHVLAKETDDSWGRKFYQDRASPQASLQASPQASLHVSPQASPQVFRMDSASTEIKKTSDGRSEERIPAMKHSNKRTIPEDSTQEDNGQELLHACVSEQWDVAEALIKSGGMLEAQDKDGRTPLHICCIKGKMEMVKLLIECGSNITAKDKLDNCCLHHKETLKNHDVASLVIEAFVEKDTSVDQPNKNDMTPLMVACQSGDICSQAALILITHGARVDGLPNVKDKPLICASARGNAKMVDYLLTYCADINQKDGRDGSTALIQACLCNHPGIVKLLLEREANVNLADKDGTTALAAAVSKNAYEMVQMLIEKAADVNCTRHREGIGGSHEETPLASACARGYRDIAELLIHSGANVNFLCSDAVPPIGFAIICRQHHMVRFLLEVEGYDKSIYGLRIPLDIAVRAEKYAAAKILLDARGGPEVALQEAQQNHLFELADRIQIVQSLPEADLSLSAFEEPAVRRGGSFQMRDQTVKVEEVLQTFSQICMAAITSNKDCEQFLEILKALKAPSHISSFIQGFYRGTQRPDILKATFLSSDTGISPASFFISHQFVDAAQFHIHAMEFFPDGPGKFYEELVWTFHQISGGEDLPYDVNRVLDRMFSGHFSLNVHTATIGGHVPLQHHTWPEPQPYANLQSHKAHQRSMLNDVEMGEPSSSIPSSTASPRPGPSSQLGETQNEAEISSTESHYGQIPNDGGVSTGVPKAELTEAAVLQSPSLDTEEAKENSGDHKELRASAKAVRHRPEILKLSETRTSAKNIATSRIDTTKVLPDPETPENQAVNHINTTASLSDPDPETPEDERKNVFGEVKSRVKLSAAVQSVPPPLHKAITSAPTSYQGATVPTHGMLKGHHRNHPSTAERKPSEERHSLHLRLEIKEVKFMGKRIGVGAFGFVEAVEVKGKICAAKHFRDDSNFKEKTFIREFQIMQALKHDHIVDYYGYYMPKQGAIPTRSPVLIMECLETNLSDFLVSESHKDLPLPRKVCLLYGIAQGLNYLHSVSVIHRDLTATNVLLDSQATPKISDFGNSCVTGVDLGSELHSQSLTKCPGTLNYMAPEAQSSPKYGTEIDIFSFGHLSLFVGIQQSPIHLLPPNDPDADDDDDSVRGRTEFQRRQEYFTLLYRKIEENDPLVLLMKMCLRNSPKRRPKAQELVSKLDAIRRELSPPPPIRIHKLFK